MKPSPTLLASYYNKMVVNKQIEALDGSVLVANVPATVNAKVCTMLANKARYRAVSRQFKTPIRWYHIALLHEMEGEQNFNTYLGNGQVLSRKTTIVPIGRGPFKTFEEGAVDAIVQSMLDLVTDWSVGNTLYKLEGFNGYGYEDYHSQPSPYIFSGSNIYTKGKYDSDGKFNANSVSSQIGIALLYKHLQDIGELTP